MNDKKPEEKEDLIQDLNIEANNLQAQSQWVELRITVSIVRVKCVGFILENTQETRPFHDTPEEGFSDARARIVGVPYKPVGIKGIIHFEINERNGFSYSFNSPYIGANGSAMDTSKIQDPSKYAIYFWGDNPGNLSDKGPLGHVRIHVQYFPNG